MPSNHEPQLLIIIHNHFELLNYIPSGNLTYNYRQSAFLIGIHLKWAIFQSYVWAKAGLSRLRRVQCPRGELSCVGTRA